MALSATLMERLAPYHLPLELARGKINQVRGQAADWIMGGLMMPSGRAPLSFWGPNFRIPEVTAGAPCSKTLEGVAKSQLAAANNLVTFSVGGVTVVPKASFRIDFADGVLTVEGKNTAGDKVTILSVASLTSCRLDVDGAKDLKNVTFAGSLNTPVIAKKGLF